MPDPAGPDQLDPLVRRVVDAPARYGAMPGVIVLDPSAHVAAYPSAQPHPDGRR